MKSIPLVACLIAWAMPAAPAALTFNKDVLPILQRQGREYHRPGEIAPLSFMTYRDTRPWAKAIKSAILTQKMPPSFMDRNERNVTAREIATITAWVDDAGLVGQSNLLVKVNFPHDVWVKAAEVRPGNPTIVHRMKAGVRPPGSAWMKDAPEGTLFKPTRGQFGEAPNVDVPCGPQTTDEMQVGFMGFIIDVNADPAKLFPRRGRPQIVE